MNFFHNNKMESTSSNPNAITNENLLNDSAPLSQIDFLPAPDLSDLPYVNKEVNLYANLYEINLKENKTFYQYSVHYQDDLPELSSRFKMKIISKRYQDITNQFGLYIYTGNCLYGEKDIKDIVSYNIIYKQFTYTVTIKPTKEIIELKKDKKYMKNLLKEKKDVKSIIEIMIKDSLKHNPTLKYIKNLYGKKEDNITVNAKNDYNDIEIMPGFLTRVISTDCGLFLNVSIKNKILSSRDCLYLINSYGYGNKPTKDQAYEINQFFKDRIVETSHTGQRLIVDAVCYDKTPKTFDLKFDKTAITMVKFYKKVFGLDINPNSPLLRVKAKRREQSATMFFPPEVCYLVGLTDDMQRDSSLIKNMVKEIKVSPDQKIHSINNILQLLSDKTCKTKKRMKPDGKVVEEKSKSTFDKMKEYGLEVVDVTNKNLFSGYILDHAYIYGESDKREVENLMKPFKIYKAVKINFICFYHPDYERDKNEMIKLIKASGKSYGIILGKTDFKSVNSEKSSDWIKAADNAMKGNAYNIVLFLFDNYLKGSNLYRELKIYSQETKGFQTQFIVTNSLYKNGMSVMSNILIQINTKIGGVSYHIDFGKEVNDKKLMLVGVDTSYCTENGQRKLKVAFLATINKEFTKYNAQKYLMNSDYSHDTFLPLKKYLFIAITEYFKENKEFPKGIVIYRQGVSQEQKKILKTEIECINDLLNGSSEELQIAIPYYYVLVNKKCNYKFFESPIKQQGKNNRGNKYQNDTFINPDPGLLVYKNIVDPTIFEFYIQPQKVTSGTATPTNFHVAYGNLNCPKLIPKLTYELCYLYSNWRGPVRIPAPLKYAEKLAKVDPKVHDKIKNTLSFI